MFDNKYPYTDFHELNLDWFMGEFKKLVAEWEETKGEWNSLHDYVQNYFENLNVQTEINNKINAMILDGTFADIVSPFVTAALPALVAGQLPDVVAAQISAVVAAQISAVVADQLPAVAAAAAAAEVGDWLAAHIDPDTGYVIDDTLTVSQAAADAKVTGDELTNIKDMIFAKGDRSYTLDAIPGVTLRATSNGTASSTVLTLSDNSGYDSYWFVADKNYDIYCIPTGSNYYALCKIEGFTGWTSHTNYIEAAGSNGARYRNTDNNLPSSASPLSVVSGTLVSVSVPAGTNAQLVFKNQYIQKMNNNYQLNDNQLKMARLPMYIKYVNSSDYDYSTEHVEIYIPQTSGYLRYDFLHCVYNANNADIWRMGKAYRCNDSFVTLDELTTSGEWECAIKLDGRSDFAGGLIHGDEIIDEIVFFVDGKAVDITDYTSMTSVTKFEAVQYSTLYDPNDGVTAFAKHGSVHVFDKYADNNLVIRQAVKWLGTYTIGTSYLAMLPVLKSVTDHFYTDKNYDPALITLDYTEGGVSATRLYKESAGVSVAFNINEYPHVDYTSGALLMTDNGGLSYNKCYYIIGNGSSISSGTLWHTETDYNFNC